MCVCVCVCVFADYCFVDFVSASNLCAFRAVVVCVCVYMCVCVVCVCVCVCGFGCGGVCVWGLLITVLWILCLLHICVRFRAVVEVGARAHVCVCVCVCVCVYVVSASRNMLSLDDVTILKMFDKIPCSLDSCYPAYCYGDSFFSTLINSR